MNMLWVLLIAVFVLLERFSRWHGLSGQAVDLRCLFGGRTGCYCRLLKSVGWLCAGV